MSLKKRNLKLIVAYDGTGYRGWQKSCDGPSIEGALEEVVGTILQEGVVLQAASRTDAGVHARGQVVNLLTANAIDCGGLAYRANQLLPPEIRLLSCEEMPHNFHPTLDNVGKIYKYTITSGPIQLPHLRRAAWHCPYALNLDLAREAATHLIGTHDFAAFTNVHNRSPDTIRTLDAITITECDQVVHITLQGQSFLFRMARNIVGTLIYIARGKLPLSSIETILETKLRTQAGITAPAYGLSLEAVLYPSTL